MAVLAVLGTAPAALATAPGHNGRIGPPALFVWTLAVSAAMWRGERT